MATETGEGETEAGQVQRGVIWPWAWFIGWRYKQAGLRYGEACSYIVVAGLCAGFKGRERKWKFWRSLYEWMGYKPVGKDTFELVGGGWLGMGELENKMWQPKAT